MTLLEILLLGLTGVVGVEIVLAFRAAYRVDGVAAMFGSVFLRRLAKRDNRVAYYAGGLIGAVIVYNLLAAAVPAVLDYIPRPWSTVALAVALMLLLYGPIEDDRFLTRTRTTKESVYHDPVDALERVPCHGLGEFADCPLLAHTELIEKDEG